MAPRGRRREERGGQVVSNPRPIQSLRLLPGENTRGICREVALPTLGVVAFCKRWHLGYGCFGNCPRSASHIHPLVSVVDEVVEELTANRGRGPQPQRRLDREAVPHRPRLSFHPALRTRTSISNQGECPQRWLEWEERNGADTYR